MYALQSILRAGVAVTVAGMCVTGTMGAEFSFSTTQQFQQGQFINLNATGDQLQINTWPQTRDADPPVLPYIWVACSGRGTVARIATEDHYSPVDQKWVEAGDVLGEYHTAPDRCGGTAAGGFRTDPSRTTVDFDGNVWVANRQDIVEGSLGFGHVVKIGSGLAFQWVDRNCNGILDTSHGLGDILPWPNPDGMCRADDVRYAHDELVLLYQPVTATGTRTVAVDRENNIWVGGVGDVAGVRWHHKLNGRTAGVLAEFSVPAYQHCGGYGGVVDCHGILWSASGSLVPDVLLRRTPEGMLTCYDGDPPGEPWIGNSYGLGVDGLGNIWNSRFHASTIWKVSWSGSLLGAFQTYEDGSGAHGTRGVTVTPGEAMCGLRTAEIGA